MPKNSFKFFNNRECRYFPCHEGVPLEDFNCLFCYCPLDHAINCGGNYTLTEDGKKDCSKCNYPHKAENYGEIVAKVKKLLDDNRFPEKGLML